METQQDNKVRLVALANLAAMCKHVSGTCHRYWIETVTETYVVVGYSNPNEYGTDDPVFATYPCYPSGWPGDEDNPRVVLAMIADAPGYETPEDFPEADQCFQCIDDCPILWRHPETGEWSEETEKPGL
jgi:hypothetical protein